MGMISCPYCNMEISLSAVEAEDGYCPECGAVITSSSIMSDNNEDDFDDLEDTEEEETIDSIDDIDVEDIEDVDFDEDIEED
jgi:transcription initiation factor TFIIIB Brf1 subunit/transcription initiation factor TFIIB